MSQPAYQSGQICGTSVKEEDELLTKAFIKDEPLKFEVSDHNNGNNNEDDIGIFELIEDIKMELKVSFEESYENFNTDLNYHEGFSKNPLNENMTTTVNGKTKLNSNFDNHTNYFKPPNTHLPNLNGVQSSPHRQQLKLSYDHQFGPDGNYYVPDSHYIPDKNQGQLENIPDIHQSLHKNTTTQYMPNFQNSEFSMDDNFMYTYMSNNGNANPPPPNFHMNNIGIGSGNMENNYIYYQNNHGKMGKVGKNIKKNHVKKPLNAFMLYMKEVRPKLIRETDTKDSIAINKIIGKMWQSMTKEEQAKYFDKARNEREIHRKLYPNYTTCDQYVQPRRKKRRRERTCPDEPQMKKCRARYGLENQDKWCKPCKRKKKCIRFLHEDDDKVNDTGKVSIYDNDEELEKAAEKLKMIIDGDMKSEDITTNMTSDEAKSCESKICNKNSCESETIVKNESDADNPITNDPSSQQTFVDPFCYSKCTLNFDNDLADDVAVNQPFKNDLFGFQDILREENMFPDVPIFSDSEKQSRSA